MSIFDKWNKSIDGEALKRDVAEAAEGGQEFERVPHGKYEVKIDKIELKECGSERHKGEPMVSIWFKVIAGKNKGGIIFMNQLIVQGFQIHIVNQLLKSLETKVDVKFDGNYEHYNDMIMDVFEESQNMEYVLEYSQNSKGYDRYEINDVFILD